MSRKRVRLGENGENDDVGEEDEVDDAYGTERRSSGRRRRRSGPRRNVAIERDDETEEEEEDDEYTRTKRKLLGAELVAYKPIDPARAACSSNAVATVGYLDDDLTYRVRAYLDVLLGSAATEKMRLLDLDVRDSMFAVPTIVQDVLAYNNVYFSSIKLYKTDRELPEIIVHRVDPETNSLTLFANTRCYNEYCNNFVAFTHVTYPDGTIWLDRYNPYKSQLPEQILDSACINCSVLCDHVAQHVINEMYALANGDPIPIGADIHYRYTKYGTTLHSMLDITIVGTREPSSDDYADNFLRSSSLLDRYGAVGRAANGLLSVLR